jgi:glycosyltransferase involved in cell wall biosynthesis
MKPLVSVVMPAYNAAAYIGDAIESMQDQIYKNWQLCIVDDGSEDNTSEIAQNYANLDGRICVDRIIHAGCPTARNASLLMAEGDIIAKLDADDTHEPVRLEEQVNFLLTHDAIDIVSCDMTWMVNGVKTPKVIGGMDSRAYLAGKSNGPVCASLVTWKKIYDKVGGYVPHQLAGSDGDWNFRAVVAGLRWGHLPHPWYNQRRHGQQLSQRMRGMQRKVHNKAREKYGRRGS